MTTITSSPLTGHAAPQGARGWVRNGRADWLLHPLIERVFAENREYNRYGHTPASADPHSLQNFILSADAAGADPALIFPRLRWGGQFVFASRSGRRVERGARQFDRDGFVLERRHDWVRGWAWPFLSFLAPRVHFFVARKVRLLRPGEFTDRFTFDVELVRHHAPMDEQYVVTKRVPSFESVVERLRRKFPETPVEAIEKRARKFTEKIFPTFLTREAAIL